MKSSFWSLCLLVLTAANSHAQVNGSIQGQTGNLNVDINIQHHRTMGAGATPIRTLGANPSQVSPQVWAISNLIATISSLKMFLLTNNSNPNPVPAQIIMGMEQAANTMLTLVSQPVVRNGDLQAQMNYIEQSASQLMQMIVFNPGTQRYVVGEAFLNVAKAIGAVKLAIDPTFQTQANNGNCGTVAFPGNPLPAGVLGEKCSLSFKNGDGNIMMTSADGYDLSSASAALYQGCSKLADSSMFGPNNAQLCQQAIAQSKCVNLVEEAARYDVSLTKFGACTQRFNNGDGNSMIANGAGANAALALISMWDSCKTLSGGSMFGPNNAQLCMDSFVNRKFSCTVR